MFFFVAGWTSVFYSFFFVKMLMPYAMKGKKERDAIIAKNKRKRASCAAATGALERLTRREKSAPVRSAQEGQNNRAITQKQLAGESLFATIL